MASTAEAKDTQGQAEGVEDAPVAGLQGAL